MRASITYSVSVEDEAELNRLRQSGHDFLSESARVSASSSAVDDLPFTLTGSVRGQPDERWSEVVLAPSAAEAEAIVLDADETRTVTAVMAGTVEVIDTAIEPPLEAEPATA